jgi:anti-sigma factor RsiW
MECSVARSRIHACSDDELSPSAVAELQRHLDFCESCACELEELGQIRRDMAAWGAVEEELPSGLVAGVIEAIGDLPATGRAARLRQACDEMLSEMDLVLGRLSLPGGRSLPVRNVIAWGLAAGALLVGIERRHMRRARELKPS